MANNDFISIHDIHPEVMGLIFAATDIPTWASISRVCTSWGAWNAPSYLPEQVCTYAAFHDYFELLVWAASRGYPMHWPVCFHAATNGNLEMLKWAESAGCKLIKSDVLAAATTAGRVNILQHLFDEHGVDIITKNIGEKIIRCGHLHVVKWCKKVGVSIDRVVQCATIYGKFEILKWMNKHNYPACWHDHVSIIDATMSGNVEMLEWLIDGGFVDQTHPNQFMASMNVADNVEMVKWVESRTNPPKHATIVEFAAINGRVNITKYAVAAGYWWNVRGTINGTRNEVGHDELADWLEKYADDHPERITGGIMREEASECLEINQ